MPLKDIPYNTLIENERAYEIMLLRDQYSNKWSDIAQEYGITAQRVREIYNKVKYKQKQLYINHIAVALGHEDTTQVRAVYNAANECYQDRTYAVAYLEKMYGDILAENRGGQPGMPEAFIRSMPPFRPRLSKKTIARVVDIREAQGLSFAAIAKALRLTQAKAKRTYTLYYHHQTLAIVEALQAEAQTQAEKSAIWLRCFERKMTAKARYELLAGPPPKESPPER